jgi:hypothetical protein
MIMIRRNFLNYLQQSQPPWGHLHLEPVSKHNKIK